MSSGIYPRDPNQAIDPNAPVGPGSTEWFDEAGEPDPSGWGDPREEPFGGAGQEYPDGASFATFWAEEPDTIWEVESNPYEDGTRVPILMGFHPDPDHSIADQAESYLGTMATRHPERWASLEAKAIDRLNATREVSTGAGWSDDDGGWNETLVVETAAALLITEWETEQRKGAC